MCHLVVDTNTLSQIKGGRQISPAFISRREVVLQEDSFNVQGQVQCLLV